MQLFPHGRIYRFMRVAPYCSAVSLLGVIATTIALFYPGAKLGTDFVGGTEVDVAFSAPTTTEEIRAALDAYRFAGGDIVKIQHPTEHSRYVIRVREVSLIPDDVKRHAMDALCFGKDLPSTPCSPERMATEVKFSPGGERIFARFRGTPDLSAIRARMGAVEGIELEPGAENPQVINARDNKVEIRLLGTGAKIMEALRAHLGTERVPGAALRTEWIGPKAGAQLRDAAIKSIIITLVAIMAYIALRFDLRFAPGAVVCLAHDATIAVGALILFNKELNLTTVAALLTIVGFSVNDTVVVYDRVRENMGRLRGSTFPHLIDVSVSEMLGRTVLTTGTAILSLLGFFMWGTGVLKDFAFTLIVGMVSGVYSTVYIALPLTYWLDRTFFSIGVAPKRRPPRKRTETAVV